MKQILETNRLSLRELIPDDAANFYNLNLNPNVIKYTGNSAFKNVEEAREFLKNYQDYAQNGYGRRAVIKKDTNKFIGWYGLKFGEIGNETDIGFRFFGEEWNKGYATESAIACINYGFEKLNLKRIVGRAMKENTGSIKVLEKIGLKYEQNVDFEGKEAVIYKIER
ncbi:GNAT family N-acetyltransferase [Avrilella dinanensis]|uniref:GNAT family N-acetyltransferase n=1 Tax=Avrilella dinanensis TaxID=2008672 RepID=A0A2M9R2Y9_9FLAO|nr:GNAT family N-acetyltransferase [Avrilella dinanensis]PJR03093.1 GNAT family N-acetyltransferase [Avrilella dinanensis]